MKVTINIECTPEEARVFFGLPDLRPVHEAVVTNMADQVRDQFKRLEPEAWLKAWLQPSFTGMDEMMRRMAALTGGATGPGAGGRSGS